MTWHDGPRWAFDVVKHDIDWGGAQKVKVVRLGRVCFCDVGQPQQFWFHFSTEAAMNGMGLVAVNTERSNSLDCFFSLHCPRPGKRLYIRRFTDLGSDVSTVPKTFRKSDLQLQINKICCMKKLFELSPF